MNGKVDIRTMSTYVNKMEMHNEAPPLSILEFEQISKSWQIAINKQINQQSCETHSKFGIACLIWNGYQFKGLNGERKGKKLSNSRRRVCCWLFEASLYQWQLLKNQQQRERRM